MDSSYGEVIAWAAKWLGNDTVMSRDLRYYKKEYKAEPWNSVYLLSGLADIIDKADMVVTFYGKGFDWPMIQTPLTAIGRFVRPVPHTDLYYINKHHHKIGRGSLDAALTYYQLQEQKMHLPPLTWLKAMRGHPASMDLIIERARSDVRATEEFYLKIRPLIGGHPRLTFGLCIKCGANGVTYQGYKITAAGIKHRQFQCQECGGWGTERAGTKGTTLSLPLKEFK